MKHDVAFGSHMMRKIWANSTYLIWDKHVQELTGQIMDKSMFIGAILGHGTKSMGTSLSYMTFEVNKKIADEIFSIPPVDQVRKLQLQIDYLMKEIKVLKDRPIPAENIPGENDYVELKDSKGKLTRITKYAARGTRWTDDEHLNNVIQMLKKRMEDHDIPISNNNLEKMGIGKKTLKRWRERKVEEEPEEEKKKKNVVVDRPLRDGPVQGKLPPGTKIVHDMTDVNMTPKEKNKKNTQLKRDRARFGDDAVLDNPDNCEGNIKKKQKVEGLRGERDICEDER